MSKFILLLLIIGTMYCGAVNSLPTPDEERYLDKEYARELVGWLASLNPSSGGGNNPCRYYSSNPGNNYIGGSMPKRNSELINSLLSIPKNMNDAGK